MPFALFALGSNGSGQLGIGHKEDVSVPKQVLFAQDTPVPRITKVAAGGNHTLLLTDSGQVYWSGDPTSGACGPLGPNGAHTSASPVFQPLDLSPGSDPAPRISHVAATWEASLLAATTDDKDSSSDESNKSTRLLSLGQGQKGELGQGPLLVRAPRASPTPHFPPPGTSVVDLAACVGHAVAVLDNGEAWGWGAGRKGQLGEPAPTGTGTGTGAAVDAPRRIAGVPFAVRRAACGRDFTCLLGAAGECVVLGAGADRWGVRAGAPARLPAWTDVGAAWGGVYVLCADGAVLGWGRDDHGQLVPPGLPPIERLAVGSEHAVALSRDGDVLAWGWGEHGNCGPQVEGRTGDVKGRWNVVASEKFMPPGSEIVGIGAGCATSWVAIQIPD